MMVVSFLVVALYCCWIAPNTEAFPNDRLPVLCKTNLALLLGSRCDPFIQVDVDCKVNPWSSWTRVYENGCEEERKKTILKFQRNNGEPCPSLVEKRNCSSLNESDTLNTLKAGLGGFGANGPKFRGPGERGPAGLVEEIPVGPPGPPGPPSNTTTPHSLNPRQASCPLDRDIVLVVDSSGSVGEIYFRKAFEDLGILIPYLCGFQPEIIRQCRSTRVAVVTYGTRPQLVFDLNHSKDRHTFQANVQNDISDKPQYLSSLSGDTATGDALKFVADRVLHRKYGMRTHSKKTILLLTDGRSNYGSNPVIVSRQLYNQYNNLAIVALGIGNVDYDELLDITNHYNPENPLVILLESYQSFSAIVSQITEILSEGQDTCQPGATVLEKKRK